MSKPAILARVFSVFVGFVCISFVSALISPAPVHAAVDVVDGHMCPAGTRFKNEAAGDYTCVKIGGSQPEVKIFVEGLEKGILDPKDVNKPYIDDMSANNLSAWLGTTILGKKPVADGKGGITYSPGIVGSMGQYMALMMGNPPATTQTYIADVFNSAGIAIAQPAYAQGIGFAALNPILDTWKIFRNVAYFFFVIVITVIGFMIMFRQKIQGQTVVTAQQAIPSIVISLIAVTFSYAIAGLLIDIMYLAMYLLTILFQTDDGYISQNIFQIGASIFTQNAGEVYDAVGDLITQMTGAISTDGLSDVVGILGGVTFLVVFAVALAIGIFKLFFALLRTYLEIIISIVTAPLILMLGAIPGKNTFGPWIKNLVGLLASFPVVLLTLIIFDKLALNYKDTDTGFLPPFIIGYGSGNAISTLIGLGFVLIMPEVVTQAQKALGVTGGVFQQFGNAMSDAVKKGWTGGELIPGVGLSDTRKLPLIGRVGGLSGQNLVNKAAIGAGGLGAGVGGAYTQMWKERAATGSAGRGFGTGFVRGARRVVRATGDKTLEKWAKEDEEAGKGGGKPPKGPPKLAP